MCDTKLSKKVPDSDDETVAIVVARLPRVRMDNPSSTQDTREPREREMQSEEARVSNEIGFENDLSENSDGQRTFHDVRQWILQAVGVEGRVIAPVRRLRHTRGAIAIQTTLKTADGDDYVAHMFQHVRCGIIVNPP